VTLVAHQGEPYGNERVVYNRDVHALSLPEPSRSDTAPRIRRDQRARAVLQLAWPTVTALSRAAVAKTIDHTLLKPEATAAAVVELCREAAELGVFSVCVSPSRVALAAGALARIEGAEGATGEPIAVASVVGFPSGAHLAAVKAFEAERAVAEGANEIDMVIDLGAAADGEWAAIEREIAEVRQAVPGVVLKVILESALLTRDGIISGCRAAEAAGADFVKTSSGFHPSGGAGLDAVRTMVETVGGRLGVKASGGIRTASAALDYLAAGATRLGLSSSRAVLDGLADLP
jgi:deoxyribose-phosphate aldolase